MAKSIKLKNETYIDSSGIVHNKEILKNYLNNKNPKYAVATIDYDVNISASYKIPLNALYQNGGFRQVNNYIVIPKGVNLISVSGSVFANAWPGGNGYLWGQIRKNDVLLNGTINTGPGSFLSASIPPILTDVKEGDRISLIADSPGGGILRAGYPNSWLYIQVIA